MNEITVYELIGLIRFGEQPKAIEYNEELYIWDEAPDRSNWYYSEPLGVALCVAIDKKGLDTKVKVVEKVEDNELEIIDELVMGHPQDNPSNMYILNEHGNKCYLTKHSRMIAEKLNEVIRNQRKIVSEIKDK